MKYIFNTLITVKDINCRDGEVKAGTRAFVDEINENEYNADGEATPYKVYFEDCSESPYEDNTGSDWFTENEMDEYFTVTE